MTSRLGRRGDKHLTNSYLVRMDPRDRKALIAVGATFATLFAIGALADQAPKEETAEQLLYNTYIAQGATPEKARRYVKAATTETPSYVRAERDKREQERALFCAGRPEQC